MEKVSNYFVEVHPGNELERIILAKKKELIAFLGDQVVNNPSQARFLRDSPHFTLMCARTGDMPAFLDSLRQVAQKFSRIGYEITDVEDNPTPGDLIEIRTVVAEQDRTKFKDLHLAVIEASLPFNTAGLYERFQQGFSGEALQNIQYCGFPLARNLYKPHASLGRVHRDLRAGIEPFVKQEAFNPRGNYTTGNLIVWQLPFEKQDPTATPKYLDEISLKR